MKSLRNLRLIGLALLALSLAGTAGFHFIEGWSWFDGFYMVITTFTTIGYQETHPLSHAGRVFNVGLIVVGVSLVFLGIGSLTQALLEFELGSFFGRRKMEREIGRLSDHYIICGAGRVGRSAARELANKGVPFIIVDQSADRAAGAGDAWLTLVGDATQGQTLR
ncbi:MAG: ion channel, partial [Terriglobales bacterium]